MKFSEHVYGSSQALQLAIEARAAGIAALSGSFNPGHDHMSRVVRKLQQEAHSSI